MNTTNLNFTQTNDDIININYNQDANLAIITGWSLKGRVFQHKFEEVLQQIRLHFNSSDRLRIFLKLELFDLYTAKYIFKIIQLLNKQKTKGANIKMTWFAKNNRPGLIQSGHDFKEMSDFDFQVQSI